MVLTSHHELHSPGSTGALLHRGCSTGAAPQLLHRGCSTAAPQDSLITMIFGVGAAVAAFPPVMDFQVRLLGRKGTVVFGGVVFCLGAAMQALVTGRQAINMAMMLVGRIIAGFSVGLLSGNAPVYTSEIAPPALRGALVTGFQFAITVAWLGRGVLAQGMSLKKC
eukprot:Skav219661  [mRNA]  locus=scaffold1257:147776:148791:+ [translate_table: standard]